MTAVIFRSSSCALGIDPLFFHRRRHNKLFGDPSTLPTAASPATLRRGPFRGTTYDTSVLSNQCPSTCGWTPSCAHADTWNVALRSFMLLPPLDFRLVSRGRTRRTASSCQPSIEALARTFPAFRGTYGSGQGTPRGGRRPARTRVRPPRERCSCRSPPWR